MGWKRTVLSLTLFGVAFGYLEAAVVSYLRTIHAPTVQRFYPGREAGDLFPLLTLEQTRHVAPEQMRTIAIEVGREAATLVMLAAIALAVCRNSGEWAAAFAIVFGVWDILFYVFLKVLLDWPASLATWDILFLIPVPWVGPVIAPVIVSLSMIGAGVWHLRRPVELRKWHWIGITLGAVVIIVSFTLDYSNIMRGGMPRPFHWSVFLLGNALGVFSYAAATRKRGYQSPHLSHCEPAPPRDIFHLKSSRR
jgi:uncharacterized membrane protein YidH (DUF202 family)